MSKIAVLRKAGVPLFRLPVVLSLKLVSSFTCIVFAVPPHDENAGTSHYLLDKAVNYIFNKNIE